MALGRQTLQEKISVYCRYILEHCTEINGEQWWYPKTTLEGYRVGKDNIIIPGLVTLGVLRKYRRDEIPPSYLDAMSGENIYVANVTKRDAVYKIVSQKKLKALKDSPPVSSTEEWRKYVFSKGKLSKSTVDDSSFDESMALLLRVAGQMPNPRKALCEAMERLLRRLKTMDE